MNDLRIRLLVEVVPATSSGPLWRSILDEGMLLDGKSNGKFREVISPASQVREKGLTGWYRREIIETTWENLKAAVVEAAWHDEEDDPWGCVGEELLVVHDLVEQLSEAEMQYTQLESECTDGTDWFERVGGRALQIGMKHLEDCLLDAYRE